MNKVTLAIRLRVTADYLEGHKCVSIAEEHGVDEHRVPDISRVIIEALVERAERPRRKFMRRTSRFSIGRERADLSAINKKDRQKRLDIEAVNGVGG